MWQGKVEKRDRERDRDLKAGKIRMTVQIILEIYGRSLVSSEREKCENEMDLSRNKSLILVSFFLSFFLSFYSVLFLDYSILSIL